MRASPIHLFLLLLLLCCAASVKADPISVIIMGGSASTPPGLGNFSVNLTGTAFSFSAGNFGAPKQQLCGPCAPGGNFPTTIQFSVPDNPSLTYNGVSYSSGNAIITSSGFVITLPPLTIPDDLSTLIAPFSFSGSVFVTPSDGSAPLSFDLSGTGIATFDFVRSSPTSSTLTAHFDFMPTATPEPATLLLLGTGLSGVAGLVRKRRRLAKETTE